MQISRTPHLVFAAAAEEATPLTPPPAPPPPRTVARREARLGPECGDAPVDALPALRVEAVWKPGRFMRDVKYESALVTQLPFEMCALPDHQILPDHPTKSCACTCASYLPSWWYMTF